MIVFIIIMGWTLIIHGGLTYLIIKKKEYSLISGFTNRSEQEQQELIGNGYIKALEKLLHITFYLLAITILLEFLPIPFGFEIGLGLFTLILLGGSVWLQTYEVPRKKKKMLWITGIISGFVIISILVLTSLSFIQNKAEVTGSGFKVSGMYGVEWHANDIEAVELLEELPEVIIKSNGFAMEGKMKGRFRLEDPYNGAILFVTKGEAPYLYIKSHEDDLFLTRKDASRTKELYNDLKEILHKED